MPTVHKFSSVGFQPIYRSNLRWMSSLQSQFDSAKERLGTLKEDPGTVLLG